MLNTLHIDKSEVERALNIFVFKSKYVLCACLICCGYLQGHDRHFFPLLDMFIESVNYLIIRKISIQDDKRTLKHYIYYMKVGNRLYFFITNTMFCSSN